MQSLLRLFQVFAEKQRIKSDVFIVGGAVRDILLGKGLKDVDIAVKGDATNIAKKFADEINASFVLLDKDFGVARIVKNGQFIDISVMRGDSINTDLSERDITINAMAIPLSEVRKQEPKTRSKIIDPYNGKDDLSNRIIRMVSKENLIKDPLRILRIYRFAAELNFYIEENTINAVRQLALLITSVAAERVAEELRCIIKLDKSYKTMQFFMDAGILSYIFPEIISESGVMGIKLYKSIDEVLSNLPAGNALKYFEDDYRKICLKLSAIFPDAESAKNAAIRLKMSRKEIEFIHAMAMNRDKVLNFYKETEGSLNEIKSVELLKEFHDNIYALTILGVAQEFSTADFCQRLLGFYEDVFKPRASLLPIITGDDLISALKLKPSPLFKKILNEIQDMALKGKISSKGEALQTAEKMVKIQFRN